MRILVYALQSSGASLFTYWLSQLEGYIGVIDMYVGRDLPTKAEVDSQKIIVKATISTCSLNDHVSRFEPDRTILFLRDPYQNYASLKEKPFRDTGGVIDTKFQKADASFREREMFDAVITYERFINDSDGEMKTLNTVGIPVEKSNYEFRKSPEEIVAFNSFQSSELARTHKERWDIGNIHRDVGNDKLHTINRFVTSDVKQRVDELCPDLVSFYAHQSV